MNFWCLSAPRFCESLLPWWHGSDIPNTGESEAFYWGIYRQPQTHVLNLLYQSLNMGGMGYTMKKGTMKTGDPAYLRKALVNNLGEEKRTRLHIQKLQKALNIRFREIDKEKAALRNFLGKLHKTSGYFPRQPLWWAKLLNMKSSWKRLNTKHICISFWYFYVISIKITGTGQTRKKTIQLKIKMECIQENQKKK